jgi:hypothetical protein
MPTKSSVQVAIFQFNIAMNLNSARMLEQELMASVSTWTTVNDAQLEALFHMCSTNTKTVDYSYYLIQKTAKRKKTGSDVSSSLSCFTRVDVNEKAVQRLIEQGQALADAKQKEEAEEKAAFEAHQQQQEADEKARLERKHAREKAKHDQEAKEEYALYLKLFEKYGIPSKNKRAGRKQKG